MTSKAAAIRYARALFDVAIKEHSRLDAIESEIAAFVDLFAKHPTLEKVLLNPAVPRWLSWSWTAIRGKASGRI